MENQTEAGNIDTRSLADALGDDSSQQGDAATPAAHKDSNSAAAPATPAAASNDAPKPHARKDVDEEDDEEEGGGYVIGDEPDANEPTSPQTLSPVSARSLSPTPAGTTPAAATAPVTAPSEGARARTAAAAGGGERRAHRQTRHPESVHSLHSMFPDLDLDTVALVLDSTGGNTEAAINALLQMNDPTFQAPAESTQVDADAALAAHLAAEQDRDIDLAQQQHQQQRRSGSARAGGGGFGGLFQAGGGPPSQSAPANYDPSKLAYQPRVRKPAAPPTARAAYHAPPPSRAHDPSQSLIPGLPGPNEAKQWQEDFNRFAEVGISKAASTFSALKAKAAASFGADSSSSGARNSGTASPAEGRSTASPAQQRLAEPPSSPRERSGSNSSFTNLGSRWSLPSLGTGGSGSTASGPGRNVSGSSVGSNPRGLMSPSAFDKDATTVGEDELAQILARGSVKPPAKAQSSTTGKGLATSASTSNAADDDDDELLGWGGAARTKTPASTAREQKELPPSAPDAALAPSAQGNGSKTLTTSTSTGSVGLMAGMGAAGGGLAGAGLIAGERRSLDLRSEERDAHGGDDSDEEEYVSNPFADDD